MMLNLQLDWFRHHMQKHIYFIFIVNRNQNPQEHITYIKYIHRTQLLSYLFICFCCGLCCFIFILFLFRCSSNIFAFRLSVTETFSNYIHIFAFEYSDGVCIICFLQIWCSAFRTFVLFRPIKWKKKKKNIPNIFEILFNCISHHNICEQCTQTHSPT